MKKILALTLCSVCSAFAAAQSEYALEQLIDSARHNNIAIRNAQHAIAAAQQQRKEAFTKYFPNVSGTGVWFNANKGMAQTSLTPSETLSPEMGATLGQMLPAEALAAMASPISISMMKNGTIASLTAVQPVFAGGQIVNGNSLARVGEEVTHLQLQLAENEVEKTTEAYFWQMVSLQEKMKTITAVEALLADIHKDVDVAVRVQNVLRLQNLDLQTLLLRYINNCESTTSSSTLSSLSSLKKSSVTLFDICGFFFWSILAVSCDLFGFLR